MVAKRTGVPELNGTVTTEKTLDRPILPGHYTDSRLKDHPRLSVKNVYLL